MNLADLTLPISYADSSALVLVFSRPIAERLAELHAQVGTPNCVPVAGQLADGRWFLSARVLTEVGHGGLLHAMWQAADQNILGQAVQVMPWSDVADLLPPETVK